MELFISQFTNEGGRENNEDSIGISESTFVVADGLGGHSCGEKASSLITDYILKHCVGLEEIGDDKMKEIIYNLNEIVYNEKQNNTQYGNMASTVVAAFTYKDVFNYLNVGDSRLYYFRDNDILIQSKDHSVTQACVDLGEISKDEMRFHEDRNKLTRVIGLNKDLKIPDKFIPFVMKCGDAFLLCSDGFWENILEKDMIKLLKKSNTPQRWLDRMRKVITKNLKENNIKNNDNLSAVCVYVR